MLKKTFKIILFSLAVYTFLGFIALSFVLKSLIIKSVTKETTANMTIKTLSFNPFTFYLNIQGIEVKSPDTLLSLPSATLSLDAVALLRLELLVKEFILKSVAIHDNNSKTLLTLDSFDVNNTLIKPIAQEITIEKVSLRSLHATLERDKNGVINWIKYLKSESEKSEKKSEYTFLLKHAQLSDSELTFDDKTVVPSAKTDIDKISLSANNISSKKEDRIQYTLSLRVNNGGTLSSGGSLSYAPLKQKGFLELKKVSLKELTPYLQEMAFLTIDDGYLSLKTDTTYAESSTDANLKAVGSLILEELFVSDSRDKTPILTISELKLNPLTYEMLPNKLFVEKADVNSFYVNALIDDQKKMNLSSLMKKPADVNETKESFPLKIMQINVALGSADFSDLSLPVKFKTNIHDLNGAIYGVSNVPNDTSYIDMSGEVDRYGSAKLKGSINSGNPKAYADLDLNFKNLNLEAMSGYSASLAGYKIDKGKLFLDLEYDILNSEMQGENKIVIKDIKLGSKIKETNQSSIPLEFVIALLEDNDKIIDINMPVKGNVDAPDFEYKALLWKTFGNLIIKTVRSPLSILGSIMGIEGDKMEYVEFEGGSTKILPPEQEKLDNLAKLLAKRVKISIALSGSYDIRIDKRALQKEKLSAMVLRKSGAKNIGNNSNMASAGLLEDIYREFSNDNKLNIIKDELSKKYKGEEFDRVYTSAVFEECVKFQEATEEEMVILAKKRAAAIQSYLIERHGINPLRVKVLDAIKAEENKDKLVKTKLQVEVK
ncbi:MAG: DUF748 domain-containing protein [Campylobacterales bacterium]|nr:DUF748 domain-containing protein [Campylobacterales bacterium]